jgi:hypothetical protein
MARRKVSRPKSKSFVAKTPSPTTDWVTLQQGHGSGANSNRRISSDWPNQKLPKERLKVDRKVSDS